MGQKYVHIGEQSLSMVREGPYRLSGEYGGQPRCSWEPQPSLGTRFSAWSTGTISELGEYHTQSASQPGQHNV